MKQCLKCKTRTREGCIDIKLSYILFCGIGQTSREYDLNTITNLNFGKGNINTKHTYKRLNVDNYYTISYIPILRMRSLYPLCAWNFNLLNL